MGFLTFAASQSVSERALLLCLGSGCGPWTFPSRVFLQKPFYREEAEGAKADIPPRFDASSTAGQPQILLSEADVGHYQAEEKYKVTRWCVPYMAGNQIVGLVVLFPINMLGSRQPSVFPMKPTEAHESCCLCTFSN